MSWRKFFSLERRLCPRYPVSVQVEFYLCDRLFERLTNKSSGTLSNISRKGGRLQTDRICIGSHHLFLSSRLEGNILVIEFLPSGKEIPTIIKASIIWYKPAGVPEGSKFDLGLKFLDLSEGNLSSLETLIESYLHK